MAFWKKSSDPWDRKPEKKTQTSWWEQDTVPPPVEEELPLTPEEQEAILGGNAQRLLNLQ